MKPITVTMTAAEVAQLDNPCHLGYDVAKRLRKAGIPTMGKLWPYRVETGSLQIDVTPDQGVRFTWTPTPGERVVAINEVTGVKLSVTEPGDEDLF